MVSGSVLDSMYPLYYTLNVDGGGNTGAYVPVELYGVKFNFTVTSLSNGLNSIRLISTGVSNKDILTGEEFVPVLVDTEKPVIDITDIYFKTNLNGDNKVFYDGTNIDSNHGSIVLNISVDGNFLNYTFNNKSTSVEIVSGTHQLDLTLKPGQNDLDLVVKDEAGNVAHEAHQINFDNEPPKLLDETLSPDAVFKDKSVHFFLQPIEGKTNKPNVKMVIFTIPERSTNSDMDGVTCESYSNLFFRQSENRDEYTYEPIESIPDSQFSLLSLISYKEELESDENGNFEALISLQEKNLDLESLDDKKVDSVKTKNTICIIMVDRFGKETISSGHKVTLDGGSTLWDDFEVISYPTTIYGSQLVLVQEAQRVGSGGVRVGVIAKFQYLGTDEVKQIEHIKIEMDHKNYPDTKFVKVDTTGVNWAYEKDSNLLTVYIPVEIKKYESIDDKEDREWFEEITVGLGVLVTYTLTDLDVPIDIKNPVWFQTPITIENSKEWLTPKQIENVQGFLNKSIKVTEKFTKTMKAASVIGVMSCMGMQGYHWWMTAADSDMSQEDRNELDRNLFMVCDRVAGLPSPYVCDDLGNGDFLTPSQYELPIEYKQEGKVIGQFQATVGGNCDIGESGTGGGRLVYLDGKTFKEESGLGASRTVVGEMAVPTKCYPVNGENIDLSSVRGQVCFDPEPPKFDGTKCNFFGMDDEGEPGRDPSTSIISSIRCGAITDTYSHSKNLLKIQQGIYDCLEQAKFGSVEGGYCQRLFGQAVCDIATNYILPEFQRSFTPSSPTTGGGDRDAANGFLSAQLTKKETEKKMNSRYEGTLLSQSGLQSDKIINKACFGAITGDWSGITDSVLMAVESNEISPVITAPFPTSRLQGYDPVTGEISILYTFTHSVISGGQSVTSKYELVCNKGAANSEFCPEDAMIVSSEVNAGSFTVKNVFTGKGKSIIENVVIPEAPARIWYNMLRVTHTYDLNGKKQTTTPVDFPIEHKSETLFADCQFSLGVLGVGAGFKCDSIFHGDNEDLGKEFYIDMSNSRIIPRSSPTSTTPRNFYFENSVSAKVKFAGGNLDFLTEGVALVYYGVCNEGTDDRFNLFKGSVDKVVNKLPITNADAKKYHQVIGELYESLPEVGEGSGTVASFTGGANKNYFVRIMSPSTNVNTVPSFSIDRIEHNGGELKPTYVTNPKGMYAAFEVNNVDSLKLYFNQDVNNLHYFIDVFEIKNGLKSGDLKDIKGINLPLKASIFKPGLCNVYMRVLPNSKANGISDVTGFKAYSPDGIPDSEGNILSNKEVNTDIDKLTFSLNTKPTDNIYYFDIISPSKDETIFSTDGNTLNLEVETIMQDALGVSEYADLKVQYSLYMEGVSFNDVVIPVTILDSKKFDDKIEIDLAGKVSPSGEGTLSDYIFGTEAPKKLFLNYNLYETIDGTKTSKFKGSVGFYVKIK
jgi:hypothetical protein